MDCGLLRNELFVGLGGELEYFGYRLSSRGTDFVLQLFRPDPDTVPTILTVCEYKAGTSEGYCSGFSGRSQHQLTFTGPNGEIECNLG